MTARRQGAVISAAAAAAAHGPWRATLTSAKCHKQAGAGLSLYRMLVEVCVDSLQSALEAESGGADRVELCSCLQEGGVTPSHGLISVVCRSLTTARVHVLIRPRPGDFIYSQQELQIMRHDVLHAASCGAHGVVLGMLSADGSIDTNQLRQFVDLCAPLGLDLTFHRAFDLVKDQRKALDDLVSCRVRRVLSSGGQQCVMEGLQQLAALVGEGGGRISVMPGGGVSEENAATVVRVTGCSEVHGTFKRSIPSRMAYRHSCVSFGRDDWTQHATDATAVQRVRQQLSQLEGSMEQYVAGEHPSSRQQHECGGGRWLQPEDVARGAR